MITAFAKAQSYGAVYRVQFTDKNNSPYSVSNPEEFLTQRAIDRRQKMGVSVDENDIPVIQAYIDSLTNLGASVLNRSRWFNTATVLLTDTTIVSQITSLTFVSEVVKTKPFLQQKRKKPFKSGAQSLSPDNMYKTAAAMMKVESELKRITNDYGLGQNQANMIGVDYLHGLGFQGDEMVIAILDAGFYHVNTLTMFDSLRNEGRLLGYKDFVMPGNNLFEEATHGMSVASLIVGNVPGTLVGTAPHASVWLLRSEDAGSEYIVEEDNWIAAAEFADSVGADVINSSLGYTEFDDPSQNHFYSELDGNTTRISRGADIAASKGILVVNSAGNSGNNEWHFIGAPADADSILTIGAVDADGNFAYFSSYGPSADDQVKPTVCAQGQEAYVVSSSDGVYPSNGTSFSSPIMAGAVACLWQANKTLTNMEIIESVKKSASRYSNPDSMYGYGIPSMVIAHMILSGNNFEAPGSQNKLMANPNPFSEEIDVVIYLTSNVTANLSIVDNGGKVVWSKDSLELKIGYNYQLIAGLGNLSAGVYFLRVSSDSWADSSKLLKN
ncbi:MAG: hypothetical protein A2W93_00115 [Bacteroidetes bacterium GWF2_43_63]|nr:MAG: hypothetical protein A2W94_11375 [Bacteroidetes bacterium GWE2_42_42]OFY52685.1 MAG: hypothetical protein A2W93_00115 [Bacteroidetes bacterium GWF2_43_63]